MRYPITLRLLIPILLLSFFLLDNYWGYGFILLTLLSFLLEIRFKKGEISKETVRDFFNTPIHPGGFFHQTLPTDNSPRISSSGGALILLWLFLTPIAGLYIYAYFESALQSLGGPSVIIIPMYIVGLGIIYKIYWK